MENAALMRVVDRPSDRGEKLRGLPRFVAADVRRLNFISVFGFRFSDLTERLPQIWPFNQSHAEIMLTLVLADLVNGHDVRMREAGCRFGFSFKALHQVRRGQRTGADQL